MMMMMMIHSERSNSSTEGKMNSKFSETHFHVEIIMIVEILMIDEKLLQKLENDDEKAVNGIFSQFIRLNPLKIQFKTSFSLFSFD